MKQKNLKNLMILYKKMRDYTNYNIKYIRERTLEFPSISFDAYEDTSKSIQKALNLLTFKNYTELCEFLDEPIHRGINKEIQLLKWEKYFSWTQNGYAYRIHEVFNVDDYEFEFEQDENWFEWKEILEENLSRYEINNKNRIKFIEDNSY